MARGRRLALRTDGSLVAWAAEATALVSQELLVREDLLACTGTFELEILQDVSHDLIVREERIDLVADGTLILASGRLLSRGVGERMQARLAAGGLAGLAHEHVGLNHHARGALEVALRDRVDERHSVQVDLVERRYTR